MTRRTMLAAILALASSACRELARYHSSVKFSLSNDSPAAGEPFEVTFDYLDEAPSGTWSVALVSHQGGGDLTVVPVEDSSSRVSLVAPSPGGYSVQCRRDGRMIAHRSITVR
jgi:hypothetical protein